MDKTTITKIIKKYHRTCPHFKYKNPLLDKDVADLLAKGLIELLNDHRTDNENNDLLCQQQNSVLEYIRKTCKVQPTEHLFVDDNVTEVIRSAYENLPDYCNIHKDLDAFLIRNLKEIYVGSHHDPSFELDVIQALRNLNKNKQAINNILIKDIPYWNVDDSKENGYVNELQTMWNLDFLSSLPKTQPDDISVKLKPIIEKIILTSVVEIMETVIVDEGDWFSEVEELMSLVEICSVSSECFQICCSILNALFVSTNFDSDMSQFITLFIRFVNDNVMALPSANMSQLYSAHLQHIVLLLDIDLQNLNKEIRTTYIAKTVKHLNTLHNECESDLIMLLSHFNQWFNHYYKSSNNNKK